MDKKNILRIAAAAAIYVAVVVGFNILLIGPANAKLGELKDEYDRKEKLLIDLSMRAAESQEVRELRARAENKLAAFNSRLLGVDRNEAILKELISLCQQTEVELAGLSPETSENETQVNTLLKKCYWKVTVIGKYPQIMVFMNRIERSSYFLGVDGLSLMSAMDDVNIEANFLLYGCMPQAEKKASKNDGP